ncbi:hypothetical protein EV646_103174 [Kribbella antiqua]|uniref:Fibronectin type-III domain-containing protein n=1 Tax=Kribbella antiqua TaxID=2512217 RepID=A0A4R2IXI6_9ACTN|nr:hypothetical protein [Kribbella antiqua]TCO49196.1 hypothetical protein EV646_103174 [Kribbella antiqua]
MRRVLAAALAMVVGAATLTACASDPTPTDVTVGWSGDGRTAVEVTWKDDNAPNRITIEGVLSTSPSYVKYLSAGEPNSWAIPTSAFPADGNYKVAVAIGTSQGGVTSKLARSDVFDTDGPVRPINAAASPRGNGVLMTWSVPPAPQDFTPNDPLDVKDRTQRYVPVLAKPGQRLEVIGAGTTSTQQLIKSLRPPYVFQLRVQNEWGARAGGQVLGLTTSVTAAIPSKARFSLRAKIRGRVVVQQVVCPPESACTQQRATPAGVPVVLLTQPTPGARWTPAGRGKTTAGGHYEISVVTGPTRPYKVIVPVSSRVGSITDTSSSKASLTRSVVRVALAGIAGGQNKKVGSAATIYTWVLPATMNSNVVLQMWNQKLHRWVFVRVTPMRAGKTQFTFPLKKPGAYVYRYLIPNSVMAGRQLAGTVTGHIPLYVR